MKPETISDSKKRKVVILGEHEQVTITHSRFSIGERGPDLHVHHEHTDAFYVLDGELTFELGPESQKVRIGPGGFVAVPPLVGHSFVNEGDADAKWLNFHAPERGFGDFLRTLREGTPGQWDSFDMPADWLMTMYFALVHAAADHVSEHRMKRDDALALLQMSLRDLFT